MADEEHLRILMQGEKAWNQWRKQYPQIQPDLSHVDIGSVHRPLSLSYMNLSDANLSGAKLSFLDFIHSNLSRANLSRANLIYTNLSTANLSRATLSRALIVGARLGGGKLIGVNLRSADCSQANFYDADLSNADLCNANLMGTRISNTVLKDTNLSKVRAGWTHIVRCDLSAVKGLDTVRHEGPTSIGIDTIYLSKGNIPEVFLRGAGVPDNFIIYMHSLTERAIEFYSCFISYSSKDQQFAERLYADLQNKGVRCWFAPHDLRIGEKLRIGIDESIRIHEKLLVILSKHSVASDWVEKEVETAMEQEKTQKRTVLFPIRLDNAVMEIENGWPADIKRTRNIGDFRKWKNHDTYQSALQRLLLDLVVKDVG